MSVIYIKEIKVAAKWWSENICKNNQNAGDDELNSFMTTFHCAPVLTDNQRETFYETLLKTIDEHFKEKAITWNIEEPELGSYFRILDVDYGACNILSEAAGKCDINVTNGTFPCKTIMWINPGSVKVSHGYRAEAKELLKWTH